MSSPELHADDLLDREARGLLDTEELARLEGHLAVCAVCRFERSVRADFRAEFESLGAGHAEELPEEKESAQPTGRPRRRIRIRVLGMVAALLLLAGVATAELAGRSLLAYVPWSPASRHVGATTNVDERTRLRRPAHLVTMSASPVRSAAAPLPTPSASEQGPTEAPASASASVARGAQKPAAAPPEPSSAVSLFEQARAAREQGAYAVAVERYERLLALFPSSPQALTARAVLGRLLLDRGDPSGALRHFDAYLASAGTTLREEAMLGRALAFGRLGQSVQEADAWQAVLRAYPNSLHAPRARERLSVLPTP